ncbi:MAG: YchJ family metal-binding protein [Candidatus Hydrogenedentales bacterium]|jgi:SEC-C motif-containing protein
MKNSPSACPCGSGASFDRCCGPYLDGTAPAPTAEALMRSRYSAYVRLREDYLLATWHASTRPAELGLASEAPTKWLGLDVRRHEQQDTDHASVEFVARYKINGRAHRLDESSRFVREDGRWFYVDGERREP